MECGAPVTGKWLEGAFLVAVILGAVAWWLRTHRLGRCARQVLAVRRVREEPAVHEAEKGPVPSLRRHGLGDKEDLMKCRKCGGWIWGSISKHRCK